MLDLDQPENKTAKAHNLNALQLKIYGVVQAVGMRPHIYRQAVDNNLSGWAKNKGAYVEVFIQGTKENIETFIDNLNNHNIPLAKIDRIHRNSAAVNKRFNKFTILNSENITESNDTLSIKDYSICNKCKNELLEKNNKRHLYPFISCTDCGPRYSILYKYPLDRENSTYNAFTPCPSCSSEYSDTNNRRFHSQNICCEKCGPTLFTEETDSYKKSNNEILEQCISLLHQGKIIALKSISGYKLICDATNFEAIDRLRIRKNRPHNAFAVMFPDPSSLKRLTGATDDDIGFIEQKENPILVIADNKNILPANVNPYLSHIGVCLPGAALELLLLNKFDKPIIFTSGNVSGQPIITRHIEAESKLANIADNFVHHTLEVKHAIDDSVWKNIGNKPRPLRLGKGYTPIEFTLPCFLKKPVIALGAQMKNTIAIAWDNRVVISPHIGDTGEYDTWLSAIQKIDYLQERYNVKASHYLIDSHSGYTSHQWVKQHNLSHTEILHHHAHASATAGTAPMQEDTLTFTWDGTGIGENSKLWGGETFFGSPGNWNRIASLKEFSLPGAEAVIKQPWRTAASLLWHSGVNYEADIDELSAVHNVWKNAINAPLTSSIGRLFDGAAAILGLMTHTSYDGQAAMALEASANTYTNKSTRDFISISLTKNSDGLYIADWKSLIVFLADKNFSVSYRATVFHNSLAHLILDQCLIFRRSHDIENICLSGGVFQNNILVTQTKKLLQQNNFNCYLIEQLPNNDAHISYGQIIEYASQENKIE